MSANIAISETGISATATDSTGKTISAEIDTKAAKTEPAATTTATSSKKLSTDPFIVSRALISAEFIVFLVYIW